MIISIASGKGGTGKTVISASMAVFVSNKVMVDCDMDAANLYLLLNPEISEKHAFSGGSKAGIDQAACTQCKECLPVCRFNAISETENGLITIDPISCEGCFVCSYVCPVSAIQMKKSHSGDWFVSKTSYGPFVHARLRAGEENSGKLVAEVRKKAQEIARIKNLDFVLIDGPPGIGCPVIASLSGVDLALVVTEPTISGIHDMERVIHTAHNFKTHVACCINKYDINLKKTAEIESWCQKHGINMLGKIPFDEHVINSMVRGLPLPVKYPESPASKEITTIWKKLYIILTRENLKNEKN